MFIAFQNVSSIVRSGKVLSSSAAMFSKKNFLQRSEIPSYHFQKSLRRLPIPKLSDTCNRFVIKIIYSFHFIIRFTSSLLTIVNL
uniref:Uncharacterized protein n=1 Tax=Heterorhabditis bacteriophora TaxID=37862 RepID=A0A1I7XC49_HETBA